VGRFAVDALLAMGIEAEAAEPALRSALRDEIPEIREGAEDALKRIEHERAQKKQAPSTPIGLQATVRAPMMPS
jgi:HEAT repeat protein